MNNSFNINVSGSNVSLGAASQGDRSVTTGTSSMNASIETASEALYKTLAVLAQEAGATPDALGAAQSQAREMVEAIRKQEKSKVSSVLELVQKNFSWAYPAMKDFVKVAWPALLLAIGA